MLPRPAFDCTLPVHPSLLLASAFLASKFQFLKPASALETLMLTHFLQLF
uniref:Uncharacterized protein n=1 Tax=Arundo donax TaxID=35708 RepID=A0A0A9DG15_ARUDO